MGFQRSEGYQQFHQQKSDYRWVWVKSYDYYYYLLLLLLLFIIIIYYHYHHQYYCYYYISLLLQILVG